MRKRWTVEIGFNKFDGCPAAHDPLRVCEGCRQRAGTMAVDVECLSTTRAFGIALDQWCVSEYHAASYDIVAMTIGGESISPIPLRPLPPRAASQKPRSPAAPKGSTASKKGSAQKRGGTGQRKA
jgi:hypothetical protein